MDKRALNKPKQVSAVLKCILSGLQGNTIVVGRKSPHSLYNEKIASFEDDEGLYDQKDAAGFIKLQVSYCLHVKPLQPRLACVLQRSVAISTKFSGALS